MDEVGATIIADTAAPERDRRVSDVTCRKVGEAHIDGLPGKVQAVFCDAAGGLPEHLIRARRAITAEDLEAGVGIAEVGLDVVKQVEQLRIHRDLVPGPKVSEEVIDLLQGAALVAVSEPIGHRETLVGMQVVEFQDTRTIGRFLRKSRSGDSGQSHA